MVSLFLVLYYLLALQAVWRVLYFWQLKEYRLDRFKEFLTSGEANQYFLPSRYLLRPKLTPKILLLAVLVLLPALWLPPLAYYLLIPFLAVLAVIVLMPFTSFSKLIIINLAAGKLAHYRSNLTVIGITGSYGKTATKTILTHLLAAKYPVLSTSGTVNTPIGVAQAILRKLNPSHRFFIVEMGAYKRGEITAICNLVRPSIGILTGISKQHLELFGSFDNLMKAKFELLAALPKSGLAIVNGEDENSYALGNKLKGPTVKFYRQPKKAYDTNLLGDWQQLNIAAAAAAAKHFGLSDSQIKKRLKTVPEFITGLKQQPGLNGALVVNSTYNANPAGFAALIDYAGKLNKDRKILVTSGIIELGQESETIHADLGAKANLVFDSIIVTKKSLLQPFGPKASYLPPTPKLLNWLRGQVDGQTAIVLLSRLPQSLIQSIWQNQS